MIQRVKTTHSLKRTVKKYLVYLLKACQNLLIIAVVYFKRKLDGCSLDKFIVHAKDLSYYRWAQLHDFDNNNISLLLKEGKKCKCNHCFELAYEKIARSIVDVYGYPESYIQKVQASAEIRAKELEFWATGDRFLLNEIRRLEGQYQMIFKDVDEPKVTMWQSFQQVEKALGYALNAKEESVLTFHERRAGLIKEAKEHQEKAQRAKATERNNFQ